MNLQQIKALLQERREQLETYITVSKEILSASPPGSLRISAPASRTNRQYYQYLGKGCRQIYLKDDSLIHSLAQKDYAQIVLSVSEKQLSPIRRLSAILPGKQPEDIFASLSAERRCLVSPFIMTDEEFVQKWEHTPFQGKKINPAVPSYTTNHGETVRSKSELLIANLLAQRHIPYRYEFPVSLRGIGTIYPDFRILNVRLRKEYIHEHFGMMDDPVYSDRAVSKISCYMSNGIFPGDKLILTYETRNHPIDMKQLNLIINKYYI